MRVCVGEIFLTINKGKLVAVPFPIPCHVEFIIPLYFLIRIFIIDPGWYPQPKPDKVVDWPNGIINLTWQVIHPPKRIPNGNYQVILQARWPQRNYLCFVKVRSQGSSSFQHISNQIVSHRK